jgi:glutamate/aspartate transport system permease protein
MNYNWNWGVFFQTAPDGTNTYLGTIWSGLYWTIATALPAWGIALILGTLIGTLLTVPNRSAARLASLYVELFRNIPLLVQMFLWYFVMPELVPEEVGIWLKSLRSAPFVTAVICLGLYTSSRIAVQVSAGINAVTGGQQMAGMALGLTLPQTYRHVLLPMTFRTVLPPLTSEFLGVIKNSALALTIGLVELTASANVINDFTFHAFEAFTAATIIYVLINVLVVFLMSVIEQRVAVPGYSVSRSDTPRH